VKTRHVGIDYLRAIMSVFVVIWHMGGGGTSLIFSRERYLEHSFTFSDFANFHVLLLAVPTFIFMSVYLYGLREVNVKALTSRMKRLLPLLILWPVIYALYRGGYDGFVAGFPDSGSGVVKTILTAGNTAYYFFVSLIICTLVAHVFLLLGRRIQLVVVLLAVGFAIALPYITMATDFYPLGAYWSPLNFIPLGLVAAYLARSKDLLVGKKLWLLAGSALLCITFAIVEWRFSVDEVFFEGQISALPTFTRASVLFGVVFVFFLVSSPKLKSFGLVRFMAQYSLGLYCLHLFLLKPAKRLTSSMGLEGMAATWLGIVIVLVGSYLIAWILRRWFFKDELVT